MKLRSLSFVIAMALAGASIFSAQASSATSQDEFCATNRQDFIKEFFKPATRLSFENPGGDLDLGVCWWDSMFQRSAVYLTVFRPELPKPTAEEASEMIHEIIYKQKVVEIPGYSSLYEFSADFESEISRHLSDWQLEDAFIDQSWALDLALGDDVTTANDLQQKMDSIYQDFSTSQIVPFVRLKLGWVVSHALLVIKIAPLKNKKGYKMDVIDSNYPTATEKVTYRYGDRSLSLEQDNLSQFVPTLGEDSDFNAIDSAIKSYCSSSSQHAF